ncbi:hypothetical protein GCM10009809_33010 [Isoptericola hypogeus]|uniref:Uncharacterized protein n=1 Tax=Isoptericola hypogeus TaxID=300179 RepID=A0ABN2JQX8_9MICO
MDLVAGARDRAALTAVLQDAFAAVQQVLPGVRELGRVAGESAYAQMLHAALAPEGIHVEQLIIPLGHRRRRARPRARPSASPAPSASPTPSPSG